MALREPTLFILTALAGGRLHGYGIMRAAEELSGGRVTLSTGTLYGALDRLERDGFVEFAGEESGSGPPRRYYALTSSGHELLVDEVRRMRELAEVLDGALRAADRSAAPARRLPEQLVDGDDLVVRCWTIDDAEAMGVAIAESVEHLRPWMAWIAHEPMSVTDRRGHIAEWDSERLAGDDAIYGIFLDGRVAGGTGLHHRGVPATLEIGYWLHVDAVGRGLATRVARLLTDAAFALPGIDAVEIHHAADNERSSGVPRRLGFRRLDDVDATGHTAWRIEAAEWNARRSLP